MKQKCRKIEIHYNYSIHDFLKSKWNFYFLCLCTHTLNYELAVIEPFGAGEMQRFVFKEAVTGLRQLFQIYQIITFVGKLNVSTLYKLDCYFGF